MLGSPFHKMDFETSFVFEGQEMSTADEFQLETVLEEALVEIKASVDETGIASYILNDGKKSQSGRLDLVGQLRANDTKEVKEHFFLNGERTHNPECGPFEIRLYAFDLQQISDRRLKEYIRTRRIYIYRDGMRVYPYGDTDNDWIKIDVYRGTQKAGYYLSNDQVMGYIDISAEGNPNLRDKTNREGLLENTSAYEDLRVIVISALSFLKAEFEKRKIDRELGIHTREKKGKLHLQSEKVNNRLELLEKHLQDINDSDGNNLLSKLRNDYYKERSIVEHQIDIVEDLAGIGIAVDATSHDLLIVLDRAFETTQASLKALNSKPPNIEKAQDKLQHLLDQMMLVRNIMEGIQPLFRSARRRRQSMVVVDIISKVKRYFTKPLDKNRIEVREEVLGTPLVVQSSEGILLQLFINLFDNAIYWLKNSEISDRKIDILLDGEHGRVVFADNGPGVDQSDVDYIFEPFYSKKGLEGRGLGLYIARQLAERYDYELTYIMDKSEQISSGANFRVIFGDGGE
jgi:signal transduction histidine kinase